MPRYAYEPFVYETPLELAGAGAADYPVAIVGAGRACDAVVARDGEIAIRRTLPLSLTFDHRVVMGGEATRFLNALQDDLEAST